MKQYTYEEVRNSTLDYFQGDELATNVWITKYALRDLKNNYYELNPDQMHSRLAKQFWKIEKNYGFAHTTEIMLKMFLKTIPSLHGQIGESTEKWPSLLNLV